MHFPILSQALQEGFFWDVIQICHYSPLNDLQTFKTGPLYIPLRLGKNKSHMGQDQANRELVPVWQCSSWLGTPRCLVDLIPLLFRYAQILSDNLPNTVLFSYLADLLSFEQLIVYHNISPALNAWCWPQSYLLKASCSWSHLSSPRNPLWTSCDTQIHMHAT